MSTRRPHPTISRRGLLRAAGLGVAATTLGGAPAAARPLLGGAGAGDALRTSAEPLRLARVWPGRHPRGQALLAAFDDTHRGFPDGSIEVLLWPGDLARLDLTGLRYRITVDDLVARDAQIAADHRAAAVSTDVPGLRSDYRRLGDYEADMRRLAADHPDRCRMFELQLPTLEGRTIKGLEIGTDIASHAAAGRPTFYMDGLIHAREWPAGEMMIMFAHDLLETRDDARIQRILDQARTIIVPVVNADGFVESRDALVQTTNQNAQLALSVAAGGTQAYWRKNKRSLTEAFYTTLNPDAHGVDPNRNFSSQWGGPGTDNVPFSQITRGDAPFSEPESENIRRLLSSLQLMSLNSSHTFSEVILRPLGHTFDDSPDEERMARIGEAMSRTTGYPSLKVREFANVAGSTVDWAYAATGAPSYSFEHERQFHPPYAGRIATLYEQMRDAFLTLGEAALETDQHAVVTGRIVTRGGPGRRGGPTAGSVRVTKRFPLLLWEDGNRDNDTGERDITETMDSVLTVGPDGRFTYHLAPTERPFERIAADGEIAPYTVTITTDDGRSVSRELHVSRGDVVDLGAVVI